MDETPRVPDRDLLVSDAERNYVVELLNKAVGHGMLTLDEFTQRTDTALKARTRGELNAVLIDLPVQARGQWGPAPRQQPSSPMPAPAMPASMAMPGDTLELKATISKLVRTGRWSVPGHLVVRTRAGNVELDFAHANIAAGEVLVELYLDLTSARLTLPPGSTVDTNGLELTMSDIKNKVRPHAGRTSHHFVLTGRLNACSLRLRTSRH